MNNTQAFLICGAILMASAKESLSLIGFAMFILACFAFPMYEAFYKK